MPHFKSDAEAESFVETADLSGYDFSGFKDMPVEALIKEAQMNVRPPQAPRVQRAGSYHSRSTTAPKRKG